VPVSADAVPAADTAAATSDWVLDPGTFPLTSITAVEGGKTVTVSGTNFTKNDSYTVRMGWFGTRGVNGVVVGTVETGGNSTFEMTFDIPEDLQGAASIAIRFESNNTPYYSFDWFNNTDTD
jgi:hypothetical protein